MKYILTLMLAALITAGCNTSEPVAVPTKDSLFIVVKHEMVSKTSLGYVNSGSAF